MTEGTEIYGWEYSREFDDWFGGGEACWGALMVRVVLMGYYLLIRRESNECGQFGDHFVKTTSRSFPKFVVYRFKQDRVIC